MSDDVISGFCWHSSIGIDSAMEGNKRFRTRLSRSLENMSMFIASGDNTLIHKTTRCLWRVSPDKKTIEPVFSSDVLSEDEVREVMEDSA